jgi:LmbE family N-acetylglucosaminyl deacetylase
VVVCSRGESASYGTPEERLEECRSGARAMGASLELIELDGDAHLEEKAAHAIRLAGVIRRLRPAIVLAPSLVENQHPDHYRLGRLARDAARIARYGGIAELGELPPHAIEQLFFYAMSPGAEPRDISPILVDVSAPEVLAAWTAAMEAHATQVKARAYVEMQLTRARANGLRAGVGHAIALYPNDPPLVDSLARLGRGTSRF